MKPRVPARRARGFLAAAAACLALIAFARPAASADARWGLLANPGLDQSPVKGVYFFPGEAGCAPGVSGASVQCNLSSYGPKVGTNPFFTFAPIDEDNLLWHSKPSSQAYVLGQMQAAHVNTVVVSSWGDVDWQYCAPMQCALGAADELFTAATAFDLVLEPAIELDLGEYFPQGFQSSPADCRSSCCPPGVAVGTYGCISCGTCAPLSSTNPAPVLVARIDELVNRYIAHPANAQWPSKWARMYNNAGVPLYAVNLLHLASDCPVSGDEFVDWLDLVAAKVQADTGVLVGFTVDIGSAGGYTPTPGSTNFGLDYSFLAIQNFLTEHLTGGMVSALPYCDNNVGSSCNPGGDREPLLAQNKQNALTAWMRTGLPVIVDVSPGYDGRYVWSAGGNANGVWGSNASYWTDEWRNYQSALRTGGAKGVVFDSWNGYTEGMMAVPSYRVPTENQAAPSDGIWSSADLAWLTDVFSPDPRYCNHVRYVGGGTTKYIVYGAICDYWQQVGSLWGPGEPTTSEENSPGGNARVNYFVNPGGSPSAIFWDGTHGAHVVYGGIYAYYVSLSQDAGPLGRPVADEVAFPAFCANGRVQNFEKGAIYWCPDRPSWYELD